MKTLKAIALAASIILTSFTANAAVTKSPDLDSSFDSEFYTFASSGMVGKTFSDYLSLSLTGDRDLVGSLSGTSTGKVSFTAFDLVGSDLTTILSTGTLTSAGPRLAFGGLESISSVGDYFIHIAGVSTGTAGYTGTLSLVSPVPEPETYAMMLAGLGFMGFVSRRRKSVK
jgi:hypothetical protein